MIRLILLSIGFFGVTMALIWALDPRPEQGQPDLVARAQPDGLGLQPALGGLTPALPNSVDVAPALTSPVLAQSRSLAVSVSARPQLRPTSFASLVPPGGGIASAGFAPAVPLENAPVLTDPDDDVISKLRDMSYGIVKEMQKPVDGAANAPSALTATAPATSGLAAAVPPSSTNSAAASNIRTYVVQPGDSLPGISFRFYGTTVSYLDILAANREQLSDPSELRAGMVLRIPDL